MVTQALINPEVLTWARQRSGLSETLLAKKVGVKLDRFLAWETGEKRPTFKQAQKLAAATHTPFGYFFLPTPPKETLPIPDLRTVDGKGLREPSTELRDVVHHVIRQQSWYRELKRSNGEPPLEFIGKYSREDGVEEVVRSIRQAIGVPFPEKGRWEDYYKTLVDGAEGAGILVMRSGIVGSNTHRKLQVSEFRGFAISDMYAPAVFINSSDAPSARLFTLIHELAHLWIGSSGISDVTNSDDRDEVFCNAVAGEYLVPEKLFINVWDKEKSLEGNVQELSNRFHVSKVVIARRALDTGIITRDQYNEFYRKQLKEFQDKGGSGGDFYVNSGAKNSTVLSVAVVTEALSGRMLMRDAGKLLSMPPNSIRTYARKLSL